MGVGAGIERGGWGMGGGGVVVVVRGDGWGAGRSTGGVRRTTSIIGDAGSDGESPGRGGGEEMRIGAAAWAPFAAPASRAA